MVSGFTFEGALMFPFRAAHARTFPWFFALAFAGVSTALTALMMYLMKDSFIGLLDMMDSIVQSAASGASEEEVMATMMGAMLSAWADLLPWILPAVLVSWIVWTMFETASQRRYIRDEAFSLGFGADEVRMLGTSFFWYLMQAVFFIIPALSGFSIFGAMMAFASGAITEEELARRTIGVAALMPLSMLVLFPVYVFFATRFSPCFGLTVKDRKVAFLDGWTVSRGRFWPILGAFVIIIIVGGIALNIVGSIAEAILMPFFMNSSFLTSDVPEFKSLLTPGFVIAMLAYTFVRYFLSGLLMHFADGPAAFAARHDPRGGVDDALRVTEFD